MKMTKDKIGGETWPGGEVALFDVVDEGEDNWTADGAMEKSGKVGLGSVGSDGTSGG